MSIEQVLYANVAQQVEHFHGKEGVGSSSLLIGSIILFAYCKKIQNKKTTYAWRRWFFHLATQMR